ncbi:MULTISPECIES: type III-B CRISPR module-associated protein Cmr5 [Pyrobaculum]|uniref:CRISPR type III-B/RAMP module-associated protein Cmr5 n=1 Tax=Pyrobaculum arsenaticum (strain DSM 13514 / JCM 11321 / PZ6) TaxID=340102 RepID=A4WJX7_PYRAR|nr:type III-B CRISPR module-associated protein Cmr5 [Pyrobaculum arsenaticum]ABP50694.1 CRISPR-associated protein, Cmr5 family [Pyrobaculum arsenaticum DSM 13514]MCY0891130.1 type III-B CRISPR module-associated protein Cmr5 [Pyrobaculum arsenaticum]
MTWLEEALGCIKLIDSLCGSEAKSAFRTRARQIPSDIYYIGTAYAFAVLAARSGEKAIYAPGDLANKIGAICRGDLGKEEKGYALYGACLLEALKKLGIPTGNLVDTLKALDERGAVVDMEIAEYVDWLKKLAEAKFEKEE